MPASFLFTDINLSFFAEHDIDRLTLWTCGACAHTATLMTTPVIVRSFYIKGSHVGNFCLELILLNADVATSRCDTAPAPGTTNALCIERQEFIGAPHRTCEVNVDHYFAELASPVIRG